MAETLYTYEDPCKERDLEQIIGVLEDGGTIAYPTDVNWAFGCDAHNVKAIEKLRRIKPGSDPKQLLSLVCADVSMAARYGTIDDHAYRLLRKTWPGPYTMIVECQKRLARMLKDKRKTVGIRIPERPFLLELVAKFERPLLSTSVPYWQDNLPCQIGYHVEEMFGNRVDLIVDLGQELSGQETTVIDLSCYPHEIIREGAGPSEGII